MKITICGSIKLLNEMIKIKKELEGIGIEAQLPHNAEKYAKIKNITETPYPERKNFFIKTHFDKIKDCDAILVINIEKNGLKNYIGGNTFLEMGFAFTLGKPIFLLNPIPENEYTQEIQGLLPIILDNDLRKINPYMFDLKPA